MKLRKSMVALALAGLVSTGAQATIYTGNFNSSNGALVNDGQLVGINGFDFDSNGSAAFFQIAAPGAATGAQLNPGGTSVKTGDYVRTFFQAVVDGYRSQPSTQLNSITNPTGTYQLTVAGYFDELVTFAGPGVATLQPLLGTGRVSAFYDEVGLAGGGTFVNSVPGILAGVGYTDGILIADGTIGVTPGNAFFVGVPQAGDGVGSATVNGPLPVAKLGTEDLLNVADVVGFLLGPLPNGYTSSTTLQFGTPAGNTSFRTVNFFDNSNGFVSQAADPLLTLRADGNVDFTVDLPEPGRDRKSVV